MIGARCPSHLSSHWHSDSNPEIKKQGHRRWRSACSGLRDGMGLYLCLCYNDGLLSVGQGSALRREPLLGEGLRRDGAATLGGDIIAGMERFEDARNWDLAGTACALGHSTSRLTDKTPRSYSQ